MQRTEPTVTAKQIKLLLVEDNADDAEILMEMLKDISEEPLSFSHATRAHEAVEHLRSSPFDAALVDLTLPDSQGLDSLRIVHDVQPALPVIVLTGLMDDNLGVSAVHIGADDYLTKGQVNGTQIWKAVRYAIERRRRNGDQGAEGETATSGDAPTVILNEWPRTVAGCRLVRVIGRGNSAYVFLGERKDPKSNILQYAVKMLMPTKSGADAVELEARFLREAEIMAQFEHPNIVRIFDFGKDAESNMAYIVMEHIDGESLSSYIGHRTPLSWQQKLAMVLQLTRAIAEIHRCGICHRDIKPNNILVNKDLCLKLIDFGIAKLPESHLTLGSEIMGTPIYMAPEAFDSTHSVDFRADIFSIGVLTYELLLGQRPFQADTIPALADEIRRQSPVEPRKLMPELPVPVQYVIGMMLKKNPASRYNTVEDLIKDLDAIVNDNPLLSTAHHRFWSLSELFAKDWT
jgi:serine/threonine-protein kinase